MDHQAGQRPFMVCQTGDDLHLHTLVFAASPRAAAITASVALAMRDQVAHDRAITLQIEPKGMPLHQLVDFCRRVEFIGHCDQEHGSCP